MNSDKSSPLNSQLASLESFLQQKLLNDLDHGRPNDRAHTLLVVDYVKKIIQHSPELKLDSVVLVIAAYAHDWGYTNLLKPGVAVRLEHLGALKETHMVNGAHKLTKLLTDSFFDFLTSDQKKRSIHLVSVHDRLADLKDPDEIVLMEADSLGGLEPDVMGVFSDSASEERYLQKSRDLRLSKFITEYSRVEFERLFQKRQNFNTKKDTKTNG